MKNRKENLQKDLHTLYEKYEVKGHFIALMGTDWKFLYGGVNRNAISKGEEENEMKCRLFIQILSAWEYILRNTDTEETPTHNQIH